MKKGNSMKYLKFAIFIALFQTSVVYATSEKLPDNSKELICHQMSLVGKSSEIGAPYLWYTFRHKDYIIHYEHKTLDTYKFKSTTSYEIIENNVTVKKLIQKDIAPSDLTKVNLCENLQKNHYFVLEQDNYESEDDDGRSLSGKMIEIIDDAKNGTKQKYFSGIFYDQYLKGAEKLKSVYKISSGYSPENILSHHKPIPITYTLFENEDGFYLKVGSITKVNVITLKKPTVTPKVSINTKQDLIQAIRNKDIKMTQTLLEQNVDVNINDEYGTTPLLLATINNDTELVKQLISKGADVNIKDAYGITPLIFATFNNNIELAKQLVEKNADVNANDNDNHTPLMYATLSNNTKIAKFLITKGANINAKNKHNDSSLFYACGNNNIELVKLLLEKGADVNTKDTMGFTSLLWTCRAGYMELSKLLIEKGADVNAKDGEGYTPLLYASSRNNNIELIKLLLKKGANVNTKNNYNQTSLMVASNSDYTANATLLIQNGADVNAKDQYGEPLSWACRHNNIELSKLLIQKGATKTKECAKLFEK